jgi:8-oxo-dGTP pyrophosphatase MutT (NUDIX family)
VICASLPKSLYNFWAQKIPAKPPPTMRIRGISISIRVIGFIPWVKMIKLLYMVSVAFITLNNKILLFHRDAKPTIKDPDCWDLIGGHSDSGETSVQTLMREIHEEISIVPSKTVFLLELTDTWGEETQLFHVPLTEKEVASIKLGDEGKEVAFFTYDEIKDLKLTQNMKMYLNEHSKVISSLFI